MKCKYKFELSLNGFILRCNAGDRLSTGLKWCVRIGREYQAICQNAPLTIRVYERKYEPRQPYGKSYFRGQPPVYDSVLKTRRDIDG